MIDKIKKVLKKYKKQGVKGVIKSIVLRYKNLFPEVILKRVLIRKGESLNEYWKTRGGHGNNIIDDKNNPKEYLKHENRSKWLVGILEENINISNESRILELGCNVGRNLYFLHKEGYKNLVSIEINDEAINTFEKEYPKVKNVTDVRQGRIEDEIGSFDSQSIDICFSMAVLMHIPTEKEDYVFDHISRITDALITIECEGKEYYGTRTIPRNYYDVFSRRGFEQELKIEEEDFPDDISLTPDVLRIFKKS